MEAKVSNVSERCREIRENLTPHHLPSSTKRVIFRQVSTVRRINHAIKDGTIVVEISVLVIVLTVQFRVMFEHFFKH